MIQFLILFSILLSFPLPLLAYNLPDRYFINCGSKSPVPDYQRNFSGDDYFTGDSSEVEDPNFPSGSSLIEIYKTARIFRGTSGYKLEVNQTGPYLVRLHFYPFSSTKNLSDAKFDVVVSGFSVLSNFSVGTSSHLPVIKEFWVMVNENELKIHFLASSFAFVNAIEAFKAPDEFVLDGATSVGPKMNSKLLSSDNVLDVIHRINVGGPTITPVNDTLWRSWLPDGSDDNFPGSNHVYINSPNYNGEGANRYDAPPYVYTTARKIEVNDSSGQTSVSNITWRYGVGKNARHFIRLHFCDIVGQSRNTTQFNIYVNGEFVEVISPFDIVGNMRTPFYLDYVIGSDGSGSLSVSVSPQLDSQSKAAFLNGLEIMQLSSNRRAVPDESKSSSKLLVIIIGSVVGGLALILVSGVVWWFCLRSRKAKTDESSHIPFDRIFGNSSHGQSEGKSLISPEMNVGLKVPLIEILSATKNFDPKRMIGEGGFGKVYKGTMSDGVKVAVKRSEPGHGQGLLEFQTEIMVLSKIRHRHLVSLIGYCAERYEMILVYEFMEKGTLRDHLYKMNDQSADKSTPCSKLSWVQRLEICIGAARGLHYLHAGLNNPIIHRDIKSTNILLDEHYVGKVADFGLSRSGLHDQSHVSTDVKGSFGYLDPEYYRCMQLTQKSDVYSFGVVLLEVLCARPALNTLLPKDQVNLAEWGMSWQKKGQIEEIIDPMLAGKINPSSLRKFGEIAEKCLKDYGDERPNMADVLWDLEYALRLQNTGLAIDPREDSTTDVSLELPPPVVQRLPSHLMPMSEDEYSQTMNDGVEASEVFSQLRVHDAR